MAIADRLELCIAFLFFRVIMAACAGCSAQTRCDRSTHTRSESTQPSEIQEQSTTCTLEGGEPRTLDVGNSPGYSFFDQRIHIFPHIGEFIEQRHVRARVLLLDKIGRVRRRGRVRWQAVTRRQGERSFKEAEFIVTHVSDEVIQRPSGPIIA